jgi:hypothetical protein
MSRTISGTTHTRITLTSQADNPVSVTGTISVTSGDALVGQAGASNTWTIDNSGLIKTTANATGLSLGSYLATVARGSVTNASGGTISGGQYGVLINGSGNITNNVGGTIVGTSGDAIYTLGSPGTVVNAGVVLAGNVGVYESTGGSVNNLAGATISGDRGVWLAASGTVTNAGTITGTVGNGGSVYFAAAGTNRLIVDPGAVFNGLVHPFSNAGSNTVELAVGNSGTGSLTGFGTNVTNFNTIDFDNGANWSISGNTTGLSGTINGFLSTDSIDLTGFAAVSRTFASNALVLTNSLSQHATLNIHGNFTTADFTIASANGGTGTMLTTTACFASGTRIRAARGAVDVAKLRDGDMIVGLDGAHFPVIWLGHRRVDCRRHPRPWDVWPVRVAADAFGPNRPERDLRLSPDHAVFVEHTTEGGVLIPVRYLINGATIVQERADEVVYWHVELPRHAVLLADGLPCESYLDTGNRAAFDNAGAVSLHANFAGAGAAPEAFARRIWDTGACADLVCSGPKLAAARRRLIARLPSLGHVITADPALRIIVHGVEVPAQCDGARLCVALPDDAAELRLISRTAVPAELDPLSGDTRCLGVAVAWLALDGEDVTLADRRLGGGWLAPEPGLRWTTGDGAIDVRGATVLELGSAEMPRLRYHEVAYGARAPPLKSQHPQAPTAA